MTVPNGWEDPNPEWMPISLGPFHFRRNIDGSPGATEQQIVDWFAKAKWAGQVLRCKLELDCTGGFFRVSLPEASHLGKQYTPASSFSPAAVHLDNLRTDLSALAGGSASSDDIANWATTISTVWSWMESEFLEAISAKDVRIFARFNDPFAREFSEIPVDIFRLFRITEWATGMPAASIAEGPNQSSLYALYCVGAKWEPQAEIVATGLPGRTALGKEIIDAEHERRLIAGTAKRSVSEEARALHEDYQSKNRTSPTPSPKTIENNIRARHAHHFSTLSTPPKPSPK